MGCETMVTKGWAGKGGEGWEKEGVTGGRKGRDQIKRRKTKKQERAQGSVIRIEMAETCVQRQLGQLEPASQPASPPKKHHHHHLLSRSNKRVTHTNHSSTIMSRQYSHIASQVTSMSELIYHAKRWLNRRDVVPRVRPFVKVRPEEDGSSCRSSQGNVRARRDSPK